MGRREGMYPSAVNILLYFTDFVPQQNLRVFLTVAMRDTYSSFFTGSTSFFHFQVIEHCPTEKHRGEKE